MSQVRFKKTRYDSIAKRISIFENTRHKFTSEVWRETPINNCSFIITKIIELRDTMKKFMRMTALKKKYKYILNFDNSPLFFGLEFSYDCIIVVCNLIH